MFLCCHVLTNQALPRHLTYKPHTTDNPLTGSDEGLAFKTTDFAVIVLGWRIDIVKTVDKTEFFCLTCTRERVASYFFLLQDHFFIRPYY